VPEGLCRFGVLGPLELERDGRSVPLPSGRQRTLLALMLLGGGVPLSRDRLIDELWGERPPASAVSALHVHLSKLRALLDGLLVLEPAGYSLQPGTFEIDVWRFDALVEQAREEPQRAGALLTEALGLFRGEPLSDVPAEGSVGRWRRALEEKRLQATVLRFEAELAAGAAGELVPELERLIEEHPYEEQPWGQLMVAQYRAGRQAEALDTFQRVRRLLATELGLEPGEALVALQEQILAHDPGLLPGEPIRPSSARPPSNVPRSPTRLIGRDRELEALAGLVADPDVRLVSITGPGGVGKTRLLLEHARTQEALYRDGVVLVRLESVTDPALVAAEIASALGQRDGSDGPGADGLAKYLRNRELLLLIDNFEHLLGAAILVADLLAQAPALRAMVSSRTPLRIRGERVFELEPLPLPTGGTDVELSQSPAVALFFDCALAANRRLDISGAATTRAVARICQALDGLPLAIELAAARAQSLTPVEIADQLAQPLLIGEHALRDLPDRQQTLQATIRWSYDLLGEEAQSLLRSAAVFRGGFTSASLEAVAGRSVAVLLDELLEASLVHRQDEDGRFELLELVRAFAGEELQRADDGPATRAAHRRYFVSYVAEASDRFDAGEAPGEVAGPLRADHANLRAALEDALDSGDEESAVNLALGLRPVWLAGMLRHESKELGGRLMSFSLPSNAEIALLRALAFLEGFTPHESAWNRRLAERAAECGDSEALATATGNLFGRALNARDQDEMRRLRPTLQTLLTPEASPRAVGWANYFMALGHYVDGEYEAAYEHARLSAETAASVGHDFMLAAAVGAKLMAESARDGVIRQPALAEALEVMRRPSIAPLAVFALWLVGRYAAAVAPATAGRWLAHAERARAEADAELWPESGLRDEAMEVLGLADLDAVLKATPPLDHAAALTEAAAWVAERDPDEAAARDSLAHGPEVARTK
jgi:predicted ATPase/DNA-binding SARP family transcriptional activator